MAAASAAPTTVATIEWVVRKSVPTPTSAPLTTGMIQTDCLPGGRDPPFRFETFLSLLIQSPLPSPLADSKKRQVISGNGETISRLITFDASAV